MFAYVWDRDQPGGAKYVAIDGSQEKAWIPANQGFFVKAAADDVSFCFTNDLRGHGDDFVKDAVVQGDEMHLRLAGERFYDEAVLRIRRDADFARDPLDALKLFSLDERVPQVFTLTSDGSYVAVNSIPRIDTDVPVVIGVRFPESGEYALSASALQGKFASMPLLLEDRRDQTWHDLRDNPGYRFQAKAGVDEGRFVLHTGAALADDDITGQPAGTAWMHANVLFVYGTCENTTVRIYDAAGQLMQEYASGKGVHTFHPRLSRATYLVTLQSACGYAAVRIVVV